MRSPEGVTDTISRSVCLAMCAGIFVQCAANVPDTMSITDAGATVDTGNDAASDDTFVDAPMVANDVQGNAPDMVSVDGTVETADAPVANDTPTVVDVGSSVDVGGGLDSGPHLPPPPFNIGLCGRTEDFVPYETFRMTSGALLDDPRICHVYTYWNIARHDPPGGTGTHALAGLTDWFAQAVGQCDEILVTFQGAQQGPESPPSTAAYGSAFGAFQALTGAGQPLAAWHGRVAYTPWNEPNNMAPSGSGLTAPLSAQQAAAYYLAIRSVCAPADGCKVAAGDFATNGATANDIEWNCADDNDHANTPTHCAHPSSENHTGLPPSYLDQYKNYIATHVASVGLPASFRPEYLSYHPWHDVNSYIESNSACSDYAHCATRRLLQSLGGTWGGVELWDDEIGVGLQTTPAPDENTTQPCGAAFLVQLTELSPRFTRVYYMFFATSNGPLFDGSSLRPAGRVLAEESRSYAGASCAPTGL